MTHSRALGTEAVPGLVIRTRGMAPSEPHRGGGWGVDSGLVGLFERLAPGLFTACRNG